MTILGRQLTRRSLISGSALAGLGAVALAPGRAAAWSTAPADAETERLYRAACGRDDYHGRLAARMRARLAGLLPDASIYRTLAAMKCPICGCPLI
jgi:hypothetical protein